MRRPLLTACLRPTSLALALLLLLLVLPGCGHPATREECAELFTKSAELVLREDKVTDPAIIAERIATVRPIQGEEFVKSCMGKRISKNALECARKAQSRKEFESCL